ncbi:MAG: InlB B-repeat-containing protein [Bacilli bacterium]|nr:InlB B-repeat-containing protein [Bacilli bacterium]
MCKSKIFLFLLTTITILIGLNACSKSIEYTIYFETNGGNLIQPIKTDGKSSALLPTIPLKDGYLFDGWFFDEDTFLEPFTTDSFIQEKLTDDITVYAKWQMIEYQITYELFFGMNDPSNPSVFTIEDEEIHLQNPQRFGYAFLGWYIDENLLTLFDFDSIAYEDITLYAKWEELSVDKTYYLPTFNVLNLNPHNSIDSNSEELFQLLTDSLFEWDFDWIAAREILLNEGHIEVADTITFYDWFKAGHSTSELPYNCYPTMASGYPISMDEDGLVWRITLREDLVFEDGTMIDSSTFEYSWKMLLDPLLKNSHAIEIYQGLSLLNAEAYFSQIDVPVEFEEVGFQIIDPYTFEITLDTPKTSWDVMRALTTNSTGVVHPIQYEDGMNEFRTYTTYGTKDNPLVGYGPYVLSNWEPNELYYFTRFDEYYDVDRYQMKEIQYNVYDSQIGIVADFKDGLLDMIPLTGEDYLEMEYTGNVHLSPTSTSFRFALNALGSNEYSMNPMLSRFEFRKALFYAINREELTVSFRKFSNPSIGFIGSVYYATPYSPITYRSSLFGREVLADFSPDTYGYDPILAKELFDQAYADAVSSGDILDGDIVHLEYKFNDLETSQLFEHWLKSSLEEIFNAGENIFQLDLVGVSSSALNKDTENGDFEMIFTGWQGVNYDAPYFLGQVYNSKLDYMVEKGIDTANMIITVELPYSKVALSRWIDAYLLLEAPTIKQTEAYQKWVTLYDRFIGDHLTVTYDELSNIAYEELWNEIDLNYLGKNADFDQITAAMERILLEQMISIPLFTRTNVFVSSGRVAYVSNDFHPIIAFNDLRYTYFSMLGSY